MDKVLKPPNTDRLASCWQFILRLHAFSIFLPLSQATLELPPDVDDDPCWQCPNDVQLPQPVLTDGLLQCRCKKKCCDKFLDEPHASDLHHLLQRLQVMSLPDKNATLLALISDQVPTVRCARVCQKAEK